MRRRLSIFAALSVSVASALDIIPAPRKIAERGGVFVAVEDAAAVAAKETADSSLPPEGYVLSVETNGIAIRHADAAGAFYARQTLRQIAVRSGGRWTYPCVEISDWPSYRWRGAMLDEGRHFFGKETVRRMLDLMARYKFNVFHWHLTEDQGWRLDVPGYPRLARCGGMRRRSPAHGADVIIRAKYDCEMTEYNTERYGPFFYTADDVREIVAYARERHIEVVPEIEMPGHTLAALGAYPEFACFPERIRAGEAGDKWGISRNVICVGNDSAVRFLERTLDFVCELFPSKVVHIGGDECPRLNWEECPKCRARMKAEGLKDANGLQAWITARMARYLAKKGRRAMGWDEILGGDVPKDVIGQSWRTEAEHGAGTELVSGAAGAARGFDMVMSPLTKCYYSYMQGLKEEPFPRNGPNLTLETAYSFDPVQGVPENARAHVLGGQCCLWGEYIWNRYDLEWRMWPRAMAMAEVLWTAPSNRDFADFSRRAAVLRKRLVSEGVNCAPLGLPEPCGQRDL